MFAKQKPMGYFVDFVCRWTLYSWKPSGDFKEKVLSLFLSSLHKCIYKLRSTINFESCILWFEIKMLLNLCCASQLLTFFVIFSFEKLIAICMTTIFIQKASFVEVSTEINVWKKIISRCCRALLLVFNKQNKNTHTRAEMKRK